MLSISDAFLKDVNAEMAGMTGFAKADCDDGKSC